MKTLYSKTIFLSASILLSLFSGSLNSQNSKKKNPSPVEIIQTNLAGKGINLEIEFTKGKEHNHPLMAAWAEDTLGNYIQTFYVSESIAKGIFKYGEKNKGKWMPGETRRPAALPYWSHKRNIKESDGLYIPTAKTPLADAYTGATPQSSFILSTRTDENKYSRINILFEINQSWDWNEYWTNDKFPGDKDYMSSSQPALVYCATVDLQKPGTIYELKLIGRSHYSGADGKLYTDLNTITTARRIASKIVVRIK